MNKKKNRYNIRYYNGFIINVIPLFIISYFPTQTIFVLCKSLYINGEFFE